MHHISILIGSVKDWNNIETRHSVTSTTVWCISQNIVDRLNVIIFWNSRQCTLSSFFVYCTTVGRVMRSLWLFNIYFIILLIILDFISFILWQYIITGQESKCILINQSFYSVIINMHSNLPFFLSYKPCKYYLVAVEWSQSQLCRWQGGENIN